jgi:hypothetical protein
LGIRISAVKIGQYFICSCLVAAGEEYLGRAKGSQVFYQFAT